MISIIESGSLFAQLAFRRVLAMLAKLANQVANKVANFANKKGLQQAQVKLSSQQARARAIVGSSLWRWAGAGVLLLVPASQRSENLGENLL